MSAPINQPDPVRRTRRQLRVVTGVSVVAVLLAAVAIVIVRTDDTSGPAGPTPSVTTPTATRTPSPTRTPTSTPTRTTTTPPVTFAYQPLWPFRSVGDAAAWQAAYRSNGSEPWHLDAARTAQRFTTGYLGFTEIGKVISSSVRGSQAWVAVGSLDPNGDDAVAAVLHLARIGAGADAPWEVVGSTDTTFSLLRPAYGARITSPVTVGGRITGLDEGIRVAILQPSSTRPLGSVDGLMAGGDDQPWSAKVAFSGATDPVLTVVACTGGHFQGVERFTITAVRSGVWRL